MPIYENKLVNLKFGEFNIMENNNISKWRKKMYELSPDPKIGDIVEMYKDKYLSKKNTNLSLNH